MKNRREFLAAAAALILSSRLNAATGHLKLNAPAAPGAPTVKANLTVSATRGRVIPVNFTGLSYESQQLSDPDFFSPANHGLIAQFKALSPHGVLRLGGNTSDFSWWKPTADTPAPVRAERPNTTGEPQANVSYPITPAAIDQLKKFLHATGWTCIYGLNLGTGIPAVVADEAACVAATLGPQLEYFQLGNEADLFGKHLRDGDTWTPDAFFAEWLALARTVLARVPGALFGGPDTASRGAWIAAFGENYARTPNPPRVVAITHHHYAGGPPSSEKMTIPFLLGGSRTDHTVDAIAAIATTAAAQAHSGIRLTEGNTCYRGGKPGVSDVFAASLWSADYLLHLASLGYSGVNLHGGDGKMVANSLGGTLPGELLMKNPNEPHPRPFYTPIAHIGNSYVAEPIFYGMLFAQQFAGATLLDVDFNPVFTPVGSTQSTAANATAFAAIRPDGKTIVAIINKDVTNDLMVRVTGMAQSSVLRLTASAPDARDVTFAHAAVTATGVWDAKPESAVIYYGHNAPLRIAKASAVLIVSR